MEPANKLPDNPTPQPSETPAPVHVPGETFAPAVGDEPIASQPIATPETSAGSDKPTDQPGPIVFTPQQSTIINGKTVGSEPMASMPAAAPKTRQKFARKAILLPLAAVLVLLGGSAAAYFAYFVPNQPDNIWKTALSNTGKGYDRLVQYAGQQANAKGIDVSSSFKLGGQISADGSFIGKSDGGNSDFSGSLSASGMKINLDIKTIKSAGNSPDLYIKVGGLQGLGQLLSGGDPQAAQVYEGLNDQWYFIDHTFFEQYTKGLNNNTSFTPSDLTDAVNAIGAPTKKYIFTDNTQNMAIIIKQKIGKETQDGRHVYHYKAGFNKGNLKAYNNELCDSLKNTKLFKLLMGSDPAAGLKDCKDTSDIDKMDGTATADAWVDTNTKLIHKIRIYNDQSNKDNFIDIGQNYTGGNVFPFSLGFHQKSDSNLTSGNLTITLDTSANTLVIKGSMSGTGSSNTTGSLKMTIKPNDAPVKVTPPTGAKSLIQLLDDLGFPLGPAPAANQTTNKIHSLSI